MGGGGLAGGGAAPRAERRTGDVGIELAVVECADVNSERCRLRDQRVWCSTVAAARLCAPRGEAAVRSSCASARH